MELTNELQIMTDRTDPRINFSPQNLGNHSNTRPLYPRQKSGKGQQIWDKFSKDEEKEGRPGLFSS